MKATELTAMATFWTAVTWIGMDMFLPALPLLNEYFPVSEATINITLFSYQVAMAVGSLLGGAISDRSGRRKTLLWSAILFVTFMAVSAAAFNIWILIASRFISGFAAGSVGAIVMAVIKDELDGAELDRAVTTTQSLLIIGPLTAPFLGSLMISLMGWRGIFIFLAVMGLACTIWILPLQESLPVEKREVVPLIKSLSLVGKVAKDRSFTTLLIALCTPEFCFGVFMTVCSYIYLDNFGLSYLSYSVCYSATTMVSIAGPFIYLALHKHMGNRTTVKIIPIILAADGIVMLLIGNYGALLFLLTCIPIALMESMARSCSYVVLLRAAEDNVGSASALIGFTINIVCALGIPAASLPWSSHMTCVSTLLIIAGAVGLALVIILLKVFKSKILDENEENSESAE